MSAQSPCLPPATLFERSSADFFNDEQEVFLGDAIVAQSASSIRVVNIPEATAHLDRIGERLLRRLPPSGIRFRFHLVELPESNAFALPGGHIYLSRKLIAIVRDEDEIAGVVAHEMGHILAHQSSSEIAGEMRRLLKVDKAGNRQEVFELYSRLEEAYVRTGNPPKSDSSNERRQSAADRIALFSLAAAGYDPEGLPRALDRITDLHGKTGNFLTDLFGFTNSEARRVRDMLKAASKLPAECVERAPATDLAGFAKWQAEVAQLNPARGSESLSGVISVRKLAPPLATGMTDVRFSPDGRHALAQDPTTIHVFSVSPFQLEFEFDALGAGPAEFSPDGREIVFITDTLRVERWSQSTHSRTGFRELPAAKGCDSYAVSPDGSVFACFDANQTLHLTHVDSGEVLLEKNQPAGALRALILAISKETPYFMAFSPDGNWFLGAPNSQAIDAFLYNLRSKQVVKLPGHAQEVIAHGFTFLSNDRILARGTSPDKPAAVVEIPSGKIDSRIKLPAGEIRRLSNPGYALLRPFDKTAAGVIDIDSKMFVLRSNVPALDRFEDLMLCERGIGDLGLYRGTAIQSTAPLQQSKLPPSAAGEFSPNLDRLTLSAATHAMIWDLAGGRSRLIRPFVHAEFGSSAELLLTATKQPGMERSLVHFDLSRGQATAVDEIPESDDTEAYSYWIGSSRVILRQPKDAKRRAVEVEEMAVRRTLWKREFELWPLVGASLSPGVLVFSWPLDSKPVDALAKADPELKKARKNVVNIGDARLVQLLDAATGAVKAQRIVEGVTIPFETAEAGGTTLRAGFAVAGDYLLASSTDNRLVIERWADGVPLARTFGRAIAFDPTQSRLAVRNAETELRVVDAATGSEVRRLQFPNRIVLASFRADGRQLGVVTADQQVYVVAIP